MRVPEYLQKEYVVSTDDFKQPKEFVGKKAVALLICRLILLEPGTDPARPTMGVGLVSRYRYMYPDKLTELKNDIIDQIRIYLPEYTNVPITLTIENRQLIIEITVDDDVYKYVTVEQEDNSVTLTELLQQDI